jgi:hypothetical protein
MFYNHIGLLDLEWEPFNFEGRAIATGVSATVSRFCIYFIFVLPDLLVWWTTYRAQLSWKLALLRRQTRAFFLKKSVQSSPTFHRPSY